MGKRTLRSDQRARGYDEAVKGDIRKFLSEYLITAPDPNPKLDGFRAYLARTDELPTRGRGFVSQVIADAAAGSRLRPEAEAQQRERAGFGNGRDTRSDRLRLAVRRCLRRNNRP